MENIESIKDIIDRTGMYTGLTMGNSMWPLIHQQRDNIIIVKPKGRLKKYDVPVYITESGKYVMHRIVKVEANRYIIIGDNYVKKEYVTDDMICGVLAGFYKNGKRYVDCFNSKSYLLYARVWVALLPVRPLITFTHRVFSYIKRHVFTKGGGSAEN